MLGPTHFGEMAVLIAFPSLVLRVFDVGPGAIVSRFVAMQPATGKKASPLGIVILVGRFSVGAAAVAILGVALMMPFVLENLIDVGSGGSWAAVTYAVSLIFVVPRTVGYGYFSASTRDVALLSSEAALPILSLLAVGITLQFEATSHAVVFGLAGANVVAGIISSALISQQIRRSSGGSDGEVDAATKREIYGALRWNFVTTTFGGLVGHAPVVLLGWGAGAPAAGYYRLSSAFIAPIAHLESAIRARALPKLTRAWSEVGERGVWPLLRGWAPRGWLIAMVAFAFVAGAAHLALGPLVAEAYLPARTGILFRAAGAAVSLALFYVSSLLYARGRFRFTSVAMGIYGVAVAAVSAALAPRFGFQGVAIGTAIAQAAFNVGLLSYIRAPGWVRSTRG